MTNGDRIRQMSNEELAEYMDELTLYRGCNCCKYHYIKEFNCVTEKPSCKEGIKAYLDMEVEE